MSTEKNYLRNRKIANGILFLSAFFTLFLLILEKFIGSSFSLSLFQFLGEAVLIASVADGIAIYALTNRIPLPFMEKFTGLVQNKRAELLDGIVVASENQFFPKESLVEKVEELDSSRILKEGRKKIEEERIFREVEKWIGQRIEIHKEEWSLQLEKVLKEKIQDIPVEKILQHLEKGQFKENQNKWLNNGLDLLKVKIESRETAFWIREELQKMVLEKKKEGNLLKRWMSKTTLSTMEKTKTIDYSSLSLEIQNTLIQIILQLQEEMKVDGVFRFQEEYTKILQEIRENPKILAELDSWKDQILHSIQIREYLNRAFDFLKQWILTEEVSTKKKGYFSFGKILKNSMDSVLDEMEEKGELSQEIKKLILLLIESQYDEILLILRELLETLTDEQLVKKVNDIAGGNLQWLRISGAYVGAVIGLLLFLIIAFPQWFIPLGILLFILLKYSSKIRKKLVYYRMD